MILVIFKVWRISEIHLPIITGRAANSKFNKIFFMSLGKCKRKITPVICNFYSVCNLKSLVFRQEIQKSMAAGVIHNVNTKNKTY